MGWRGEAAHSTTERGGRGGGVQHTAERPRIQQLEFARKAQGVWRQIHHGHAYARMRIARINVSNHAPLTSLSAFLLLSLSYPSHSYLVHILMKFRVSGCLFVGDRSKQMCHLDLSKHYYSPITPPLVLKCIYIYINYT